MRAVVVWSVQWATWLRDWRWNRTLTCFRVLNTSASTGRNSYRLLWVHLSLLFVVLRLPWGDSVAERLACWTQAVIEYRLPLFFLVYPSFCSNCLQCSDTVGWAAGRASGLWENWVVRCWCCYLSGARCRLFACGPADATAIPKPHHLLLHLNRYWFYLSDTGLPRLFQKRGR